VATIRRTKGRKPISEKTRAADDELRKRLENVTEEDMKKFDKALEPAIEPKSKKPEQE
jgi:hypothetical protein